MMQRLAYKLQSFMFGRNGADKLGIALLFIGCALSFALGGAGLWGMLSYVPILLAGYRMFSKDLPRRRKENQAFCEVWSRITGVFRRTGIRIRDGRSYKFFACPKCGAHVRVPRGKGSVSIACPKCSERFIEKT